MSTALNSLDLDKHLRTLRILCPRDWHVAITSESKVLQSTDPAWVEPVFEASLTHAAKPQEAFNGVCVLGSHSFEYFKCPLGTKSTSFGNVLLYAKQPNPTLPNMAQIQLIVEMLSSEVALNEELDSMAEELADRYEELNLVYTTGDQLDTPADDDEALVALTKNVVQYLDAEFVLLGIPDKKIWLIEGPIGFETSSVEASVMQSAPDVMAWLTQHNQPLIINEPIEAQQYDLSALPYRTLATPVRQHDGTVIGCLAMCKSMQAPRIENGDKNLLSAMAHKVAKVIQNSYDAVTGLAKQGKFLRALNHALTTLGSKESHALIHVNIKEIQYISDQHGIKVSDQVIAYVGQELETMGRATDITCRLDDGDFALLLVNCSAEVAIRKAEALCERVKRDSLVFNGHRVNVNLSVGIAELKSADSPTADDALAQAHIANRIARESVDSTVQKFTTNDQLVIEQQSAARIITTLHRALMEDEFTLYAQDIAPLNSDETDPHFEILLRLFDEHDVMVSPAEFIPLAERHNLMAQIDLWVVTHALQALRESALLEHAPQTLCSINLSGQSLSGDNFLENITRMINNSGVKPSCICLEVTETSAIHDLTKARYFITSLRELGCKFALDDFGAGLSSFTYLRTLPLDFVKIDGFFVKDILTDPVAETMVKSIHEVGTAMGLETVAEYVEDTQISDRLTAMGIHFGQGFGIGKPMPFADYIEQQLAHTKIAHG